MYLWKKKKGSRKLIISAPQIKTQILQAKKLKAKPILL